MNSKQRRKAYRAMPKVGTAVTITSKASGKQRHGVVVGRVISFPYEHPKSEKRRSKFDTARIQVLLDRGGMCNPLLSTISY